MTPTQEAWLVKLADQQMAIEAKDAVVAQQAKVVADKIAAREAFVTQKTLELQQAIADFDGIKP